ncbi:MAG: thrombospondin type 3 repeat-containing protein, partial [Pseudomonadota bacterium]
MLWAVLVGVWANTAPAQDADLDGIDDRLDNCRLTANTDQTDADGDGWGNRCDADLSNDGTVNFADLAILRDRFFTADPVADLNVDGIVDNLDLALMRESFFSAPGPAGFSVWLSAGGGSWTDPTNWLPAVVPPAGSFVRIESPGDAVVLDDPSAFAVAGIETARLFRIVDGQLAVTGDVSGGGAVDLAGGELTVQGTLSVANLDLGAGTLAEAT